MLRGRKATHDVIDDLELFFVLFLAITVAAVDLRYQ